MANLRKAMLQENVFTPKGEKLMHVLQIQVSEGNEDYCLCLTVTRDEEVQITFLKILPNGLKEKYMTQAVWFLEDLTVVDGRDATAATYFIFNRGFLRQECQGAVTGDALIPQEREHTEKKLK
ncbi:exocyst complex component 1-like isoform X3 [Chiloscyllium plagiosum]|uniref:exocyst complex component 1-like isoform X3 n=1 Tax=Chiloscyllium plagiosum TaxID=36176 RepID=UPI001CB87D06|nr:exocyst complex component 1-like isoform X3 [Chiloscyllium plagiosum]